MSQTFYVHSQHALLAESTSFFLRSSIVCVGCYPENCIEPGPDTCFGVASPTTEKQFIYVPQDESVDLNLALWLSFHVQILLTKPCSSTMLSRSGHSTFLFCCTFRTWKHVLHRAFAVFLSEVHNFHQ